MSSTQITTNNLVRDDVARTANPSTHPTESTRRSPRAWAMAGLVAAVTGAAALVISGGIDPAYDKTISGDPDKVMAALAGMTGQMTAFHLLDTVSALLMLVFAAGLFRRLRRTSAGDSLFPAIAAAGAVVTSTMSLVGSGLDTEFIEGVTRPSSFVAENAVMYNHWIGTIPWVWTALGLSALAVAGAAFRRGGVPRWIGAVSLVMGALTVVAGASPQQYLSGMIASIWLLVTSFGFVVGDRRHRA